MTAYDVAALHVQQLATVLLLQYGHIVVMWFAYDANEDEVGRWRLLHVEYERVRVELAVSCFHDYLARAFVGDERAGHIRSQLLRADEFRRHFRITEEDVRGWRELVARNG